MRNVTKADIKAMRAKVDEIERHLVKGQLYGAYKACDDLYGLAYQAKADLSNKTKKAAQDWGYL